MWSVKRWGEIEPRGSNLTTSPTGDRGEEEQVKVANVGRDHDGKVRGEVGTEPGSSTKIKVILDTGEELNTEIRINK